MNADVLTFIKEAIGDLVNEIDKVEMELEKEQSSLKKERLAEKLKELDSATNDFIALREFLLGKTEHLSTGSETAIERYAETLKNAFENIQAMYLSEKSPGRKALLNKSMGQIIPLMKRARNVDELLKTTLTKNK